MHVKTKDGRRIVNLDRIDYIELDGDTILAYRGDKHVILGIYADEELALTEFSSLMAVMSRKDKFNVIEMG